jgi:hypothetical protein
MVMLGRAIHGDAVQRLLRNVADEILGDFPDRLLFRSTALVLCGFKHQCDLLVLLEPYRLNRAKDAVLIDSFLVL